jgi:hypothetical protein
VVAKVDTEDEVHIAAEDQEAPGRAAVAVRVAQAAVRVEVVNHHMATEDDIPVTALMHVEWDAP